MIRAREAHQRLAAAFRDLDTDGASVTGHLAPLPDPKPCLKPVPAPREPAPCRG